jgi:hypothetical protein
MGGEGLPVTRLHVLTACTRPDNLPTLAVSLAEACCGPWEICWHLRLDPEQRHVGGQRLKNDMLDQVSDGWVCFLDDDTTIDPRFLQLVDELRRDGATAVVVSQQRENGAVLPASRANLHVGSIDIGQAIIHRGLIGNWRIPLSYEGDGVFLASVLGNATTAVFVDEILSYHNRLNVAA